MKKNILVIGGAGYIGSHATYELTKKGYKVTVLDDLSTGNREAVHKDAKFYKGDQCNIEILNKIFTENKIDGVMHFSAKLIVPDSVKKPIEYFENNVYGVIVLLKAMKKHNIKNIVFSSTAAVYGEPENSEINEDDKKEPINPYGASKLSCEWLIKSAAKAHGMNYVIFRYFNVAGADASGEIGQSTKNVKELTHLVPVVAETILGIRKEMTVYGDDYKTHDGSCVRDYIHVTDLAIAHISGMNYALENKSGTFNLGSSKGYSVLEVIKTFEKLGYKVNYKIGPRRDGDPGTLIAKTNKAEKKLGIKNKMSLESMLESDIKWRSNKKF